jgi:hypothetical protein
MPPKTKRETRYPDFPQLNSTGTGGIYNIVFDQREINIFFSWPGLPILFAERSGAKC